jgi:hypothetical protein
MDYVMIINKEGVLFGKGDNSQNQLGKNANNNFYGCFNSL